MHTKNLTKRLALLEKIVNPPLDMLIVIVNEGETTEAAKQRVMQEQGINELPEQALVFTIDTYGSGHLPSC